MKVHIVGAGGVGGYYCSSLARAGADVSLVCRPRTAEIFRTKGLAVNDRGNKSHTTAFNVLNSIADIRNPELIILAVKTYHLEDVARALAQGSRADSLGHCRAVLTLQNGIEADQLIKKHMPSTRVLAGLTWVLATMVEPGFVEQKGSHRPLRFGLRTDHDNELVEKIQSSLQAGGIDATASPNIVQELWEKFIWLTNFSGMAGSRQSPIAPLVSRDEDIEIWCQGFDELIALARRRNVPVREELREELLKRLYYMRDNEPDAKPSLLKDLEAKRPTEVEALSGAAVRMGKRLGIATPVNYKFYTAIRQLQDQYN